MAEGLELGDLEGPLQLNHSTILWFYDNIVTTFPFHAHTWLQHLNILKYIFNQLTIGYVCIYAVLLQFIVKRYNASSLAVNYSFSMKQQEYRIEETPLLAFLSSAKHEQMRGDRGKKMFNGQHLHFSSLKSRGLAWVDLIILNSHPYGSHCPHFSINCISLGDFSYQQFRDKKPEGLVTCIRSLSKSEILQRTEIFQDPALHL